MLIFVLQTLAEILAGGTSLVSTKQIDFGHPSNRREEATEPILNVYVYDIRESKNLQHSGRQFDRQKTGGMQTATVSWPPTWFDVSVLLTAWDKTALGEHHLLTEALTVLLRHRSLREEFLLPELRGYGNLSMTIALEPAIDVGSLWSALTVPLRAALFLTVTIPFEAQSTSASVVWDRIISIKNNTLPQGERLEMVRQVKIAGLVKHSVTSEPVVAVKITLLGTEKVTTSDAEGLFFFENLSIGNYAVKLDCLSYLPQTVNFLVESHTHSLKEILLTPVSNR
jgi:Pvc16 N-terminal domain/Carboxypeptidase regulatory-like domain